MDAFSIAVQKKPSPLETSYTQCDNCGMTRRSSEMTTLKAGLVFCDDACKLTYKAKYAGTWLGSKPAHEWFLE